MKKASFSLMQTKNNWHLEKLSGVRSMILSQETPCNLKKDSAANNCKCMKVSPKWLATCKLPAKCSRTATWTLRQLPVLQGRGQRSKQLWGKVKYKCYLINTRALWRVLDACIKNKPGNSSQGCRRRSLIYWDSSEWGRKEVCISENKSLCLGQ